jgi:hypothetical protein
VNKVRGYLTRRANGLYLVTAFRPVLHEVIGAERTDAYFRYGDPMAYINITPEFVESVEAPQLEERVIPHKICFFGGLQPATHLLSLNAYDLYTLDSLTHAAYIDHICPWFIKKMFNVVELHKPIPVHFTGEIYGSKKP